MLSLQPVCLYLCSQSALQSSWAREGRMLRARVQAQATPATSWPHFQALDLLLQRSGRGSATISCATGEEEDSMLFPKGDDLPK